MEISWAPIVREHVTNIFILCSLGKVPNSDGRLEDEQMQFEEVGLIEIKFGLSCSQGNWAEVRSIGRPGFKVGLLVRIFTPLLP